MAARGVSRVLDKLEASINSGEYYEAHQMYRTLYFRYSSQKKYSELLELLYKGSTLLLQRDQQGSGADLAILLTDVLTKSETKPREEWILRLGRLFGLMKPGIPERDVFLTSAVKWSMDKNKRGHPLLHKKIAEEYWLQKRFTSAHRHYLLSNDGTAYGIMLVELHTTRGFKTEFDKFVAQAMLQCLCLRNLKMAKNLFYKYTEVHPAIRQSRPSFPSPLLNFLFFLILAIEQKSVNQFNLLRRVYAKSIQRDKSYSSYLNTIGRIWFGIEKPRNNRNPNSVFSGILKNIIGDVNMESSDEETDNKTSKACVPDLD